MLGRALAFALSFACAAGALVACGPPGEERPEPRTAKPKPCPPPPEPAMQAVVVGTIGKQHLAESRYGLSKLGDVVVAFRPELVLVGVRVDAFREDRFEDASFEMAYVTHVARQRGAAIEPIDWFREQDLAAPPPDVEPWDALEIAKRETEVLSQPKVYTFEQANDADLMRRVLLAQGAEARHRAGAPLASRRRAWVQELAASAVVRFGKPRRVLAFVDVLDRPAVDAVLHAAGYTMKSPVDVASAGKEVMMTDVPADVVATWKAGLTRAHAKAEAASAPAEKAFWSERERVLSLAVDKRGACCVSQTTLAGK